MRLVRHGPMKKYNSNTHKKTAKKNNKKNVIFHFIPQMFYYILLSPSLDSVSEYTFLVRTRVVVVHTAMCLFITRPPLVFGYKPLSLVFIIVRIMVKLGNIIIIYSFYDFHLLQFAEKKTRNSYKM